ncbi:Uncharacterized protein BP5553_09855 [Venustampulla echinocandica]|uniref:Cupin type-2 domain-containing protein n=1 Tax=Venustampulla echinocandica TaxID=2656787 RepID=A0A370TAV1_9HELO|nr:Uncharacterized protein BP5553_09855 [Venustampulla echinocandica]RDL31066.1 Uncharacterized protein BP5553_09855 [Venustampulla echinocandica]
MGPPPCTSTDASPASARGFSHPKRFITDHDSEGNAVFSTTIPEQIPFQQIPGDAIFSLCYATNGSPVTLNNSADINVYSDYLENLPGVMIPGGTVLRMVDMPPGATSPMHRTVSLDYGVVLEGQIELVLDNGESRLMKRGDVSVQRGTMHAWRNASGEGKWARMLYVLQESRPLEISGQELGEDYGGLQVPESRK